MRGGIVRLCRPRSRANRGNIYALAGETCGAIRATGVSAHDGRIYLVAEGGTAEVACVLDARGAGGTSGVIETSAATLVVAGFAGTLEGLGHEVSRLTIEAGVSPVSVGLFGVLGSGGVLRDIGVAGGSAGGADNVGALVGYSQGMIVNARASAAVSGTDAVGLVGRNEGSVTAPRHRARSPGAQRSAGWSASTPARSRCRPHRAP